MITPKLTPLAIEKVSGIKITVRKAGTASDMSAQSMSLTPSIISAPTRIRAGAVAAPGTAPASGQRNIDRPEQRRRPCVAVSPVRPPSSMPDALSTYAVVVEVPTDGAEHGGQPVHREGQPGARHVALLVQVARPLRQTGQGAGGVEEVDEEEGEDDAEQTRGPRAAPMSSWPTRSLGQTGRPTMPFGKPANGPGRRPAPT